MKTKEKTNVRIVEKRVDGAPGYVVKFKSAGKTVTIAPNKSYAYRTFKDVDSAQRQFRKQSHLYGMKSGSWTYSVA